MSSDPPDRDGPGKQESTQPPGSVIATWIPVGVGLGVAMGLAFGNLALGIAIGAAIGVAIGAIMEKRGAGPGVATESISSRWLALALVIGLLLLGLVAAVFVFLASR